MANKVEIKTNLVNNAPEILAMCEDAKQQALNKIGLAAIGYAKRLAPVDTGRLRSSIAYATKTATGHDAPGKPDDGKARAGDYTPQGTPEDDAVYIGTNVEYATYQEFGIGSEGENGHKEGHHFIGKALSNHTSAYKKLIENTYKQFYGDQA